MSSASMYRDDNVLFSGGWKTSVVGFFSQFYPFGHAVLAMNCECHVSAINSAINMTSKMLIVTLM